MRSKLNIKINNSYEFLLIAISSILLGIWAVSHTIAMRNALLGFGFLLALPYWVRWFSALKNAKNEDRQISTASWLPLGLIAMMFLWVILHMFFFTDYSHHRLEEIGGTWIRAFLATLIGSAVGLALIKKPNYLPLLWAGIFLSFIALMMQYFPKMMNAHSMFAFDYGGYIYWAKFSGVLSGTLLIAGLLGLMIDGLPTNWKRPFIGDKVYGDSLGPNYGLIAYCLFGILLVSYAHVFIFDAKAGVGLAVILIGFWCMVGVIMFLANSLGQRFQASGITNFFKMGFLFLIIVIAMVFLSYKHMKHNPGWENLIEDIHISAQITKYPNWRNPSQFGYPSRKDGSMVVANTYERVAWGTAGLKMIAQAPLGNGFFRTLPEQIKKLEPNFHSAFYTHSAWIDFGLAYGWPGIILMPMVLLVLFTRAALGYSRRYRATVMSLSLGVLVLYSVGEYAFQYGVEILFFICSLMAGLALTPPQNNGSLNETGFTKKQYL